MADLETVTDLWVRLADEQRAYGSHLAADENREPIRMALASSISNDGLLVAKADDAIRGFVSFDVEEGALEQDAVRGIVRNLYVEESARDDGIGTALLEGAEDTLVAQGADVVALESMAENHDARGFYRARGYHEHRTVFEREP